MIPPENNPCGSCLYGFQGVICADCIANYSRSGDYGCSECPDYSSNIVRLSFIILGAIAVLVVMIKMTLDGAIAKRNVTSIFTKILMSHLQLIALSA